MFQKLSLFISRYINVVSNPDSDDVIKLQDLKHFRKKAGRNCEIAFHTCTDGQLSKVQIGICFV